jgi:hypothetical protein
MSILKLAEWALYPDAKLYMNNKKKMEKLLMWTKEASQRAFL